ncbi:efflux RND transporter permease subunit [Nereida sp.]|uniref:efflux RND transporter permease subunit n=1 Tax=Nereida sp. TaxID=2736090 RepID=UPI003F6A0C8D
MVGMVDWAASRARMIVAFIVLSIAVGAFAYVSLPKEGEPDIEIPALVISLPFPGISAEDSEKLLVKPIETELSDLDGLKRITGTAVENYANVVIEFEFGWDKPKILADVRDRMNTVEANFPNGAEKYKIEEINFSEFPIIIVNLTGSLPERTLVRVAKDLQDKIEGQDAVLEAALSGQRDEMVEVVIDPLKLESYNVTANELINVVANNNLLVAAGNVDTSASSIGIKIPSSFDEAQDIYSLPVKTNGDRVITLGDLTDIRLTFEDRAGTARFNSENTVALQVVKRKGFNIIDTADMVRELVEQERQGWEPELRAAIQVGFSNDQSRQVGSMVSQLESSVLTAIALVMIVVLAALGPRPALLVGFAIPTSFLLCFVLLALLGVSVSNIVMFGLILAVGMLVDGAIVVVEYGDKRLSEGASPMQAYTDAAKRMFWPIVSSTATTLCAFLPFLFWPGVPGEFMGMLPVTMIFVLSASLLVALIYLPVVGGISGRMTRVFGKTSDALRDNLPWLVRLALVVPAILLTFAGVMAILNTAYIVPSGGIVGAIIGCILFSLGAFALSITVGSATPLQGEKRISSGRTRTIFGKFIRLIVGNPIMPVVSLVAVMAFVMGTFTYFGSNNNGVEFFVESEPEQAIVYVRARGNLSLEEKDAAVRAAEEIVLAHPGVVNVFAFAGEGGLDTGGPGGGQGPRDTIGRIQLETIPWDDRADRPDLDGNVVLDQLSAELAKLPGIKAEISELAQGPAQGKPLHLRIRGDDLDVLKNAALMARAKFEATPGLTLIEDTLPLPGFDWQIDVDVEKAGRYGANVATVGGMVQLVTRGILLGQMRVDSSDAEIDIRVRLPEKDRVMSTLDTLRVRTPEGLVPLSNFITVKPVAKLGQIDRVDQKRHYDVKADVETGLAKLTLEGPSGADGSDTVTTQAIVRKLEADAETSAGQPIFQRGNTRYAILSLTGSFTADELQANDDVLIAPINANERITLITDWIESTSPFPAALEWEWAGDQEEQAESGAFLMQAFAGALGLMFIILLAQFNSFYNSVLVLLAVILSTTGVLIGMLVMDQAFSIIMTGTGIVALAGIVVNNNIVLIDTYQEYNRYMPRIEAIIRTAEDRIRPVLLTTITTMAGLAPMMFGLSLDFIGGGYSIDSPTALWWKQLATAVVFGLGIATVLTLVFTPSLLALRVWVVTYARWIGLALAKLSLGKGSVAAQDWALRKEASQVKHPEIIWRDPEASAQQSDVEPLKAAE